MAAAGLRERMAIAGWAGVVRRWQQAQPRATGLGCAAAAGAATRASQLGASLTWPSQHGRLQTTAARFHPSPTMSSTSHASQRLQHGTMRRVEVGFTRRVHRRLAPCGSRGTGGRSGVKPAASSARGRVLAALPARGARG